MPNLITSDALRKNAELTHERLSFFREVMANPSSEINHNSQGSIALRKNAELTHERLSFFRKACS